MHQGGRQIPADGRHLGAQLCIRAGRKGSSQGWLGTTGTKGGSVSVGCPVLCPPQRAVLTLPESQEFNATFSFFAGSKIQHLLLLPPMLLLPPLQPLLLLLPRLSLPHPAAPFLTQGAAADGAVGQGPWEVLETEAPTVLHPSCVSDGCEKACHRRRMS